MFFWGQHLEELLHISNETLSFKEEQRKGKNDSNSEERTEEKVLEEEDQPPTIKKSYSANPKIVGLAAVGLLAIILTIYSFASTETTPEKSPEEHLKEIVTDYYQSVNSNQIEAIPDFLSPRVDQWYGAKNLSHSEILKIARDRHGKYPFSSSDINWDSFTVIPQSTGGFLVTYEMTHKFKKKIIDDYQIYDLKLYTRWDEDFKLKSIREIKN
ncbi:hypothetical protein SAMN05660413_01349 [Salegentibacter flavus]|uniref:Uncharacterized protein n=1 Tax=Salegentibacter flavus TaxID=287099 RepID=A0A1I4ZHQ1_9FLAO|nr:hypothetical protein SAMN05660413_01349 [Salegentibacter flavus]